MAELEVLHSPLLARVGGVRHAFFTRKGGVSTGIYESLNVGRGSRDDAEDVRENRRRAAAHMGVNKAGLLTCFQIHSADAITADAPWGEARPDGDAVVTRTAGLACGALSADCAPVLLADPQARVVGALHAGWGGALKGIVASTVTAMTGLGAKPSRIVAAIGPCIGPASYEVGLEFLERFEAEAPGSGQFFSPGETADKRMFDLPRFVLMRLSEAGVELAEWIGADTCAEESLFFSNRRAFKLQQPDYGRLLSAIALT